jgi:hypothetical protein
MAAGTDERLLGVAVAELRIDGVRVEVDDTRRQGAGWHEAEAHWQWTNGFASLASPGARRIEIAVMPLVSYWDAAPVSPTRQRRRYQGS